MTDRPEEAGLDTPLIAVAQTMRDRAIGDVIVTTDGELKGIVTDRDIVVRAIAEGMDPERTTVDAVFSGEVVSATPDTSVRDAAQMMRENAIRRLPVVEDRRVVGVVSIGDLAMYNDEDSALSDISIAEPNE